MNIKKDIGEKIVDPKQLLATGKVEGKRMEVVFPSIIMGFDSFVW